MAETEHPRPSDSDVAVWLVSASHKTRTPLYVPAQDVFVYAHDAAEAAALAAPALRRLGVNRRWWHVNEPVKTLHRELPR